MIIQERDIQKVANEVLNVLNDDVIEAVNNLHDALLAKDIEKIDELLKAAIEEIEVNFSTQEELMEENSYPMYQTHKRDHDNMRKKWENYAKRWEVLKGPTELRSFVEKEFRKWFIQHVSRWDSQLALGLGNNIEY